MTTVRASAAPALRALPIAVAVGLAAGLLGWKATGSVAAADWLGSAVVLALVLAVVAAAGAAAVPPRAAVVAAVSLALLAAWTTTTALWSPLPTLARDEGLLTLLYVVAFALPLVSLRETVDRTIALALLAAAPAAVVVAAALAVAFGDRSGAFFTEGRLDGPIAYANGQASLALLGLWPALCIAASHGLPVVVRALACGAGGAMLATWVATQSKGAGIGLGVAAVVVFAAAPARLRLAVPALVAAVPAALAVRPLTEPFRSGDAAAPGTGRAILAVAGAAAAVGAAYAVVDRRTRLSPTTERRARRAAAAATVAAAVAGAALFVAAFGSPVAAATRAWDGFATYSSDDDAAAHLVSLGGSNRYDFWRVSLEGFAGAPIHGIGARGFGALYLREGESPETPARAHSLVFEILLEQGLVGFVLLAAAVLPPLALAFASTRRRRMHGVAALGGCTAWLVHASVDWTWTFPALGIPFFVLLGLGATRDRPASLDRRRAAGVAAAAAAAALLLLAPPWLAARLAERALAQPREAEPAAAWARRLDPVSVVPLLVQGSVAPTATASLPYYEDAAEREPRSLAVRYVYGLALLNAGRPSAAVEQLEAARALAPGSALVEGALRRARAAA